MKITVVHPVSRPDHLGEAIRKQRKKLGFTQEDLSMQTGISRPTIRAIEAGKPTAQVGLVLQLCADLGMSISIGSDRT